MGYEIIERWKNEMTKILKMSYPKATKEEIQMFLEDKIKENLKYEDFMLYNNYEETKFKISTLDLTEYYYRKNPITTEHGVLFDPKLYNPSSVMINKWKGNRKKYKAKMKKYDENSYEFRMTDLYQLLEKIKTNAYYGASGATTAIFYNLHAALSTTGKGRALISLATTSFESFTANNTGFFSTDECIQFINNVVSERNKRKYKDDDILDNCYIGVNTVYRKLINTFDERYRHTHEATYNVSDPIYRILLNLNQEDLNRIYYKNNLYEFFRNSYVKTKLTKLLNKVEVFNNPSKVPDIISSDIYKLWELIQEYVFYNYQYSNRMYRLMTSRRDTVVVIDTDSNMLNLDPWLQFVLDEVLELDIHPEDCEMNFRHKILYTMAYFLSEMISEVLYNFMTLCNVPEEKRRIMEMKNEYLFLRMIITNNKKNYSSIIEFKEGKDMHGKLDIKGLALAKSTTNRNASKIFKDILENDILKSRHIDIGHIINKLNDFKLEIENSLKNLEKTYLKPVSLKDLDAYDDPYRVSGVLGYLVWNILNPDNEITLPDNFFILKTTLTKESQLEIIKHTYPNDYDKVKELIFNCPNEKIAKKGCYQIAIPSDLQKIPEWVKPFIDISTITNDTLKPMNPVLECLRLSPIYSKSDKCHFSNIVYI